MSNHFDVLTNGLITCALVIGINTGIHAAHAQSPATGAIEVTQAWARPTVEGQQGGGGFLKITNKGKADDKLIGASAPVAERMELHTMTMENNVMRMREIKEIVVKAGETVELKPGGLHVMFMGLKQPMAKDSKVPVTLVFEKAGKLTVQFAVQPRAPEGSTAAEAQHGHGAHKH
jgi:copper(I)-binding protein